VSGSRVLVTGGAGFVGSHLARALLAEGHAVDVADDLSTGAAADVPAGAELIEVDLGARGAVPRALEGRTYAAICHLAGQSSGEKSFDDPEHDLDANARSTVALASWALDHDVPALLHASSMGVYGQPERSPVAEDAPTLPLSWYGASKLAAERALAVAGAGGLRTLSLRMFSIYGPGQNLEEMRQGVVSIFLSMALRGEPIDVHGSLDRVRDFVYVDDCVEAWVRALAAEASGALNLGTGVGTSFRDMIAEMLDQMGRPDHPVAERDAPTPGDQRALWGDTSRLRRELGWVPATPLRDGLAAMLGWAADAR
jgi:UDP-glucose 4-epimerase